jgi:hypothetical protein
VIGAVFGPTELGETGYACKLLHLLRPDMLVLWDRGFDTGMAGGYGFEPNTPVGEPIPRRQPSDDCAWGSHVARSAEPVACDPTEPLENVHRMSS